MVASAAAMAVAVAGVDSGAVAGADSGAGAVAAVPRVGAVAAAVGVEEVAVGAAEGPRLLWRPTGTRVCSLPAARRTAW